MTVRQLIDKLSEVEDKNRKIAINSILNYPFNQANIKNIEGSKFGTTVWIVIDRAD